MAVFLGGCAAVNSNRELSGNSGASRNGITYYLPKGRVVVALSWNPVVGSWDVTPTVIYQADPDARFDLDWSNFFLSDKDTSVSVDPETGLLEGLNASSPGQNFNNVSTRIGAAPNVVPLGASVAALRTYGSAPDLNPPGAPYLPTGQVILGDDDRSEQVAYVASPEVQGRPRWYAAVRVTLTRKFELGPDFPRDRHQTLEHGKGGGIVVRMPVPYELAVDEVISRDPNFRAGNAPLVTCSIPPRIVMLPDSKHEYLYRVLSRPLVSDTTRIALANGMLQTVEQVRPGMLEAILTLPKYLVTNVIPIPVEITQTQQNISNAQSQVNTGQAAASQARTP